MVLQLSLILSLNCVCLSVVDYRKETKVGGGGAWLKWYSACLASWKPLIQVPVLTKNKEKEKKKSTSKGESPLSLF
jgi:hypothetical protein